MPHYFDKDGKPLEMMQWARLLEDPEYKRVALDHFGLYTVSTVWLGLDHNIHRTMTGMGKPLIFETAVINRGKQERFEVFGTVRVYNPTEICERYTTLEEARVGHDAICARIHAAVLC